MNAAVAAPPRRPLDRFRTRLLNPVVRWVLRTPLHDLISRRVVLLEVTGRRSGRTIAVPVRYARDGDTLTLISKRSRTWWRNLEGGAAVRVTLCGERRCGWATVEHDRERVRTALSAITATVGGDTPPIPVEEAVAVTLRLGSAALPSAPEDTAVKSAAGPPGRRRLWWRWFVAVTLGEVVGFSVPVLAGAVLAGVFWEVLGIGPLLAAAALVVAGTVEGVVLGLAQAYVLRLPLPGVATRDWVRATAYGAAIAWAIGSLPFLAGERLMTWPPAVLVLLGTVLLVSMGALQWRVLRAHVRGAGWWVAATAGAWAVALGVFTAVTSPLWQEGQPVWLGVAIGLLGGLAMAVTVAALTGLAILGLTRPARARPTP